MPIALEQFVKQLTDSGVIAPGKLEKFIPPKASPKDAQELARQLVQSKHLTKFQAAEIYQGRAKSLILGNYTILDKIGAGGMGQVFKAHHRRMERVVAIKMLPSAALKDAAALSRFQREVIAAAKLRHPNIVAADDADEANGRHFLVMEYIEGSDLSALVKANGPISIAKAVNYILQAARGLEFAHGEGVIHRDIKPANLLLDKKGTVKILDMGLARINTGGDAATQAELTGTGAVMGTVDYMAPEQALSTKHATAQADIYSLGCTLFYLLTGKPMYEAETLTGKLLAHQGQPIPELRKVRGEVPVEVEVVYRKMVAKSVEDRYHTMSEVVVALELLGTDSQSSIKGHQSISTNTDNAAPTFLQDALAQAAHKLKPAKKSAPVKTGKDNRKFILGAVGAGLLSLAILAGIIFKLKTKDGTLVVEIDQPDAVVQVLNEEGKVEITRPGEKGTLSISVDPGKHRLKVEKDGFVVYGQDFVMESGGTQSIKANLVEDKPWFKPAFLEWQEEVAKLPAEEQVKAVVKKLRELNDGYDGNISGLDGNGNPRIEHGVVTGICIHTATVPDLSPLRVFADLKSLDCGQGKLSDLSPLAGLHLTSLACCNTLVSDLSPLKGMPLTWLAIYGTHVADLTPLKGMQLQTIELSGTPVSDVSPLVGMPLTLITATGTQVTDWTPLRGMPLKALQCDFNPERDTEVLRSIKTLGAINGKLAADFWKEVDEQQKGHQSTATFNDPAFKKWMKDVAALPAEEQVKAVSKKLVELNSGFDGKVTGRSYDGKPKIENGVVTEVGLLTTNVVDISPLRVFAGLSTLQSGDGKLADLSPLAGLHLTGLYCRHTQVSDLSPLKGMPLKELDIGATKTLDLTPLKDLPLAYLNLLSTQVSDLSPLKGTQLTSLQCQGTQVSDLSPLEGMPLTALMCSDTKVSDLTPLKGMPLTSLDCGARNVSDLTPLKGMPLTSLICWDTQVSDLTPLKGMPLQHLICSSTNVSDLTPLKGMPLTRLICRSTNVSDLSPLRGMPLFDLHCDDTQVSDLSPLEGIKLNSLVFSPRNITKGIDAIRQMKSLTVIGDGPEAKDWFPPADFWKKYDAGEFGTPTPPSKPITTFKDPAFKKWEKEVTKLPAEEQVKAVVKKLQELNPGFDGKENHKVEGGVVAELQFYTNNITDLSPVRSLKMLRALHLGASDWNKGILTDLWPLSGMQLSTLGCSATKVSDLSPLRGMPLTSVNVMGCPEITDLSPLKGLKLTELHCDGTNISTLAPLEGMPLTVLTCTATKVSDLTPLAGMPLVTLTLHDTPVADLTPLRGMKLTQLLGWNTAIADLSPLEGMPLTHLNCDNTQVSNLSPVSSMPALSLLFVRGTKVTAADVAALKKALPNCKIEWDDPSKK